MKNIWTVAELDPSKLFEVIRNRDPETSVRFSLPIPNWLDETGNLKFEHTSIADVPQKGKRFLSASVNGPIEILLDGRMHMANRYPTAALGS